MAVRKRYFKGYKLERKVKEMLEKDGWYVIRSAGSKKPDLIAGKNGRVVVIECKTSSKPQLYLKKEEVENLKKVSVCFNGEGMYAIKYRAQIYFIFLKDLIKKENSYLIDLKK